MFDLTFFLYRVPSFEERGRQKKGGGREKPIPRVGQIERERERKEQAKRDSKEPYREGGKITIEQRVKKRDRDRERLMQEQEKKKERV